MNGVLSFAAASMFVFLLRWGDAIEYEIAIPPMDLREDNYFPVELSNGGDEVPGLV